MKRKENWPSLLAEYIENKREEPFVFGVHDCSMAVAGAIFVMTGERVIENIGGEYKGKREAKIILDKFGGMKGVVETIAKAHRLCEVSVKKATGGDVVMTRKPNPEDPCLGFIGLDGLSVYAAHSPKGWIILPLSQVTVAYRIR